MTRCTLTDGTWFDSDGAKSWNESRTFDGRNHISDATGSQWEHERLYRTQKGRWVLYAWSQWQGSRDSYTPIDAPEAAAWLVQNGHDVDTAPELAGAVAALEV